MTLVALDVNASRVRGLQALASPREGRPIALDGSDGNLPLAVSLEGRSPQVGRAGVALCRRSPHLACIDFLPHLGERREWAGPRCRTDATRALAGAFDLVADRVGKHAVLAVAVPDYLMPDQQALLRRTAETSRLKFYGSLGTGLAAALFAHAQQPWHGLALVADVDGHALTWSAVEAAGDSVRHIHAETYVTLGLRAWKERLLSAVANACIRRSRRDPRDSADAEQMLYDQMDYLLQQCQDGKPAEVSLASVQWFQHLHFNPGDLTAACRGLLQQALDGFRGCLDRITDHGPLRVVIVTAAAARLPGLVASLERALSPLPDPDSRADDLGEGLDDHDAPAHVRVLGADAVAQAVLDLTPRWQKEAIAPGHLNIAPLPEAQSPAVGVARLNYRGNDLPFRSKTFTLGRDPRCDLVFETAEYPFISGQHCKIVWERNEFTLFDLSRYGTLVNDHPVIEQRVLRPGDWIRLGPGGPLLRLLGQAIDNRQLMPTA